MPPPPPAAQPQPDEDAPDATAPAVARILAYVATFGGQLDPLTEALLRCAIRSELTLAALMWAALQAE